MKFPGELLKNLLFFFLFLQIAPPLVRNVVKTYGDMLEPKARVAVVSIKGVQYDASPTIKLLHSYFKDPAIKAIVLKINCPGSTTGTGQSIYDEITHLKTQYQKPIITQVEDTCASGAFLIACATDHIVAPGMALIGSIGVSLSYLFQLRQFIENYNIKYIPLTAGAYKSTGDMFTDITPEQKALLNSMLNDSYEQFVSIVAHSRKLALNTASTWADGKVFTGKQALALGLIDELGSFSTVTKVVKEKALIEGDIEWIQEQKTMGFLTRLFSPEQSQQTSSIIERTVHGICSALEHRYSATRL